MKYPLRLLSALALSALLIPIGCREDSGPSVNSETHFLSSCSGGDCGAGLECVCGVCTRSCRSSDECGDLNPNAKCMDACADAPSPMMCNLPCSADADCAKLNPALICAAGECQEKPASAPSADTPEAFCRALLDSYIDFFGRCSGASAQSWRRFLVPAFVCGNAAEAAKNGRLTFSSSDADACLTSAAAIADSAPCGVEPSPDVLASDGPCKSVLQGAVPVGGTCLSFHAIEIFGECADGGFCDQGGVDSCAGTCKARSNAGDTCGILRDAPPCTKGLTCSHDVCAVPAARDEACEGPSAPSCGDALYCEGGSVSQAGICRDQKSSGACADNQECASGYFCDNLACARYRAVGEACNPGECYPVLSYCDAGACAARLPALGEACGTIGGEKVPCGEGYCDAPTPMQGVCVAEKEPGEACTGMPLFSECAGDDGHCDTTSLKCTACERP